MARTGEREPFPCDVAFVVELENRRCTLFRLGEGEDRQVAQEVTPAYGGPGVFQSDLWMSADIAREIFGILAVVHADLLLFVHAVFSKLQVHVQHYTK